MKTYFTKFGWCAGLTTLLLAQVFVDDVLCGTVVYSAGQFVYPIKCSKVGSVVKITLGGSYLTLCEVEVLGKLSQFSS